MHIYIYNTCTFIYMHIYIYNKIHQYQRKINNNSYIQKTNIRVREQKRKERTSRTIQFSNALPPNDFPFFTCTAGIEATPPLPPPPSLLHSNQPARIRRQSSHRSRPGKTSSCTAPHSLHHTREKDRLPMVREVTRPSPPPSGRINMHRAKGRRYGDEVRVCYGCD